MEVSRSRRPGTVFGRDDVAALAQFLQRLLDGGARTLRGEHHLVLARRHAVIRPRFADRLVNLGVEGPERFVDMHVVFWHRFVAIQLSGREHNGLLALAKALCLGQVGELRFSLPRRDDALLLEVLEQAAAVAVPGVLEVIGAVGLPVLERPAVAAAEDAMLGVQLDLVLGVGRVHGGQVSAGQVPGATGKWFWILVKIFLKFPPRRSASAGNGMFDYRRVLFTHMGPPPRPPPRPIGVSGDRLTAPASHLEPISPASTAVSPRQAPIICELRAVNVQRTMRND